MERNRGRRRAASVVLVAALGAGAGAAPAAAESGCPPAGWSRARLERLVASGFELPAPAERDALALALVPCLAAADPWLRDGVAFEALAGWMRGPGLSPPARQELLGRLLPVLEAPPDGPAEPGFRQPFAALALAEVARTDRLEPFLSAAERQRLLFAATGYLAGVRDHRDFDDADGWRHGVAHGADLLLQLALNPAVARPGLDRILAAVAAQVAPDGEVFYVAGESERLARTVRAVASRGLHSPEEWTAWLAAATAPAPLADWSEAFSSRRGLAKRHDTVAFLFALYFTVGESGDPALVERLLPGLRAAARAVP